MSCRVGAGELGPPDPWIRYLPVRCLLLHIFLHLTTPGPGLYTYFFQGRLCIYALRATNLCSMVDFRYTFILCAYIFEWLILCSV